MRHYTVQQGDSPHSIARRFGIRVHQLIAANPHKPVVNVVGQQTWSALYPGERLRVPHPNEFVAPPPPPPPAQQPWYRPWHHRWHHGLYGVGDVLAGHRYEEELRERERLRMGRHDYEYGGNPYGVADGAVGDAASDAVQALLAAGDPCDPSNVSLVCAAQVALGVQADGKWGAGTAKAAQAVFPGAPGACSPRPSWWAPSGQSNCSGPLQIPTITVPGTVPAPAPPPPGPALPPPPPPAVMAMASLDPCSAANVGAVCAAQAALGLQPDGKWGTETAHAASLILPNAPPACTPRPGWWAPKGQSNCGGAVPAPPPRPAPAPAPAPSGGGGFTPAPPAPSPGGAPFSASPASVPAQQASMVPGSSIVVPKGGSSAMAVAGVLGALGLVGIVAVVATGAHEKVITKYRTRRAPASVPAPTRRAPARRAPARRLSRRLKRK